MSLWVVRALSHFGKRPVGCNFAHVAGRNPATTASTELCHSRKIQRRTAYKVDRPVDQKIASGRRGSTPDARDRSLPIGSNRCCRPRRSLARFAMPLSATFSAMSHAPRACAPARIAPRSDSSRDIGTRRLVASPGLHLRRPVTSMVTQASALMKPLPH